jgi:hypothetical protein
MSGFNLSEWALKHRSITIYLMILAVLAGLASYYRLGRSEDPSFIIKTMVVQAQWPGATTEETLKQVTERLERTLQETPHLDFLRSFTRAGVSTIFVNLDGKTNAQEVADTWYEVRKSVGDMRHTLPAGVLGPGFNDDFGDTFGIIYGVTADGFNHRELRDHVEVRSNCSACRMSRSTSSSRWRNLPILALTAASCWRPCRRRTPFVQRARSRLTTSRSPFASRAPSSPNRTSRT